MPPLTVVTRAGGISALGLGGHEANGDCRLHAHVARYLCTSTSGSNTRRLVGIHIAAGAVFLPVASIWSWLAVVGDPPP
jgi:hypothetical protein